MRTRALLACALAAVAVQAPLAYAHEGNPNFRSEITGIDPAVDGVDVDVLNFDDSLQLTNQSDETVTVFGYEDEPYARIDPDGTVEVNKNSPAYYLNEDRFAESDVPASADPKAEPDWEEVDRTGQFAWHDHRAHYMAQGTPPQVKDESAETKVFDYEIPIDIGGEPGTIDGTLTWVGEESGFPILPFIGLGVVAIALLGIALLRRNRGRDDKEAW